MTHLAEQHTHDSDPPISRRKLRQERLARLGVLPAPRKVTHPKIVIQPYPFDFGWDAMWFYDLVFAPPKRTEATARQIQVETARYFKMPLSDFLADRRNREIVLPRQIAMYLTRVLTPKGFAEIGRRFGGRDHSTVYHACLKIESLIGVDDEVTTAFRKIKGLFV